jgi:membrane protein implicated in regulation of membrane protease activity
LDCPNCGQPVDAGALFCGNCGQALQAAHSPIAQAVEQDAAKPNDYASFGQLATIGAAVPAYAISQTHVHNHVKVILALVFGILAIAGGLFIPIIGLVLGIAGTVLATTATHASGKWLKITALVVSIIGLLTALGVWAYVANTNPKSHPEEAQKAAVVGSSANAVTEIGLTTPCYAVSFPLKLNVANSRGSCEMNAYNGSSMEASTNVYKVLTSTSATITATNFTVIAEKALQTDIAENLPGFTIYGQGSGTFAGSQAYFINAANSSSGIAVEEAAVLHSSAAGPGLFVLVHLTFGTSTNLSALESNWQWK